MHVKCESSRVEVSKHAIGVENASPLRSNSRTNHNSKAGGVRRTYWYSEVWMGNGMVHNRRDHVRQVDFGSGSELHG